MRMLIRKYPDLAELVLDQCYKEKKNLGEGVFVDMTFEFIEDSFNYRCIDAFFWMKEGDDIRKSHTIICRPFKGDQPSWFLGSSGVFYN